MQKMPPAIFTGTVFGLLVLWVSVNIALAFLAT